MSAEDDEREKRRKKQAKRMGKILSRAWDLPDSSAFQDDGRSSAASSASKGSDDAASNSNLCSLIAVGNKLDRDGYKVGKHGWVEFAADLGGVYNRHIVRRTKHLEIAKQHLETVKELLGAKDASLVEICVKHVPKEPPSSDAKKKKADSASKKRRRSSAEDLKANDKHDSSIDKDRTASANSRSPEPVSRKKSKNQQGGGTPGSNVVAPPTSKRKRNPNAELAEREDRAMELLRTFLMDRGVSPSKADTMLEGFTARVTRKRSAATNSNSAKFDTNFFNANSRRFRSMLEVGRFFGLVNDGGRQGSSGGGGGGGGGGGSKVQRQVSQQTLAEKKRLRRELERLQKAYQRASKALDDFDVGKEEEQKQSRLESYDEEDVDGGRSTSIVTRTNCASAIRPDMEGFPNVPSHCVADVLMSWDFLCTFERALSLTPIALDDFAAALTYVPPPQMAGDDVMSPPVYLAEAHLGLLKMLLQDAYSDDWWWSTLETEGTDAATGATADDVEAFVDVEAGDDRGQPVIHIDVHAMIFAEEDPLNTQSWLRALENVESKNVKEESIRQAIKAALKVCANKWVHAYLKKTYESRARGKDFIRQAVAFLVNFFRKARPDLRDRTVKLEAIEKAKLDAVEEARQGLTQLASSAPSVSAEDVVSDFEFEFDDEESDAESDDEDEPSKPSSASQDASVQRASVIPPRPDASYTDLLLPPSKPHANADFINSFTWPYILGATAHRILHRKKRLLNETDDFMRATRELPPLLVAERRSRERLTASRVLTECAEDLESGASPTERAIDHLCAGGDYLDLSTQERICLLRLLIEASYDTSRLYSVVDGNIKQRTNATKALEVEQRRAKKDAKEKASGDEAAARQQLAYEAKERFFDEKREEIRKLNERNKELSEELIDSLTEEDILDFDEDFKADYDALPKPESFNKAEVKSMVVRMQEEAAFDTDSLRVLTLRELEERERREIEEKEGELLGIGGEEALLDPSLDRETIRSIERLQRDILRAKELNVKLPEMRDKALMQLREAMADGTIKSLRSAVTAAKKAKLTGPDDETGGVWAVDLLRDAALELESAKQNKRVLDAQKDLIAKMNKCFIRSEPIGHDRFGNRFWHFDQDEDGHVWVETECVLSNEIGNGHRTSPSPGFVDLLRSKEAISSGAPDMEDDFAEIDGENLDSFRQFCRQEYHSSGLLPTLAKNFWGCHATEESLRSVIKTLDSRGTREKELKQLLKESVEQTAGQDEKHDTAKGDRTVNVDEDQHAENVDNAELDTTTIRDSGDESAFEEAMTSFKFSQSSSNGVNDATSLDVLEKIRTAIGAFVRVRQVSDASKEQSGVRYETGTVTGWKYSVDGTESSQAARESGEAAAVSSPVPLWKVSSDRGHTYWLTGSELMESIVRYDRFSNGKGYFEDDSTFLSYRNSLGRFCGRASEASFSSSPIYFARLMVKREAELYAKLKIRSYDNAWGGKSGARALWTNSMKDYAYDFATAKQGLVTLESAFFELTGEFEDYELGPDKSVAPTHEEIRALLSDPKARNDVELETIEKVPGLWNSPTSRAAFLYLVKESKTTGFLALALDQLCRNTIKYLQMHKLLKGSGGLSGSDAVSSQAGPSSLYEEELAAATQRRTRGMNSWQQRKQVNYEEFF